MSLLKQLVAGDEIATRGLYQATTRWRPGFTIWLMTNERPRVPEGDSGMRRRLHEIPFSQVFESPDPRVRAQLRDPAVAGVAVLAWAVRGCLTWQREGLGAAPSVATATASFWADQNPLTGWLEDCAISASDAWTPTSVLDASYRRWCVEVAQSGVSSRRWTDAMRAAGYEAVKRGVRGWRGIALGDAPPVSGEGPGHVPAVQRVSPPRAGAHEEDLRVQPSSGVQPSNRVEEFDL